MTWQVMTGESVINTKEVRSGAVELKPRLLSSRRLRDIVSRSCDLPIVCLYLISSPYGNYICHRDLEYPPSQAFIYLFCSRNLDLFKIGYTLNLKRRSKALNHLSTLATFECCCRNHARILEATIHNAISHLHVGGEYFDLDDYHLESVHKCFEQISGLPRMYSDSQYGYKSTPIDLVWLSRCLILIEEMRQAVRSPHD